MRMTLLLLCLFAAGGARAQSLAGRHKMDEKYGFRDVRFGTPVSAFSNLILFKNNEDVKVYKKRGENLSLGSYKLNGVAYSFYNSELMGVVCAVTGQLNVAGVKKMLGAAYGPPTKAGTKEEWVSEKVRIQWLPLGAGYAFVTAESIPLMAKKQASSAALDKKAASDL